MVTSDTEARLEMHEQIQTLMAAGVPARFYEESDPELAKLLGDLVSAVEFLL